MDTSIYKPTDYLQIGIAIALACLIGTVISQVLLANLMVKLGDLHPNFLGNGLNYVLIGFVSVLPIFDLLILVAVFVISVPVSYARRLGAKRPPFNTTVYILVTLLAMAAAYVFVIGIGPLYLAAALPPLLLSGLALLRLTKSMNANLERARAAPPPPTAAPTP